MLINYVVGDATQPIGEGKKVIAHICNNRGGWGAGFSGALSRKYPQAEWAYRRGGRAALGHIFVVDISDELSIANMTAQRGYYREGWPPAVDYTALRGCLKQLAFSARELSASVHMPRIGTGLGGGEWGVIELIIEEELCAKGISVTVYDLPKG